ncbi:MOC2A synthase, partial [Pseudoatta argentina]
MDKTEIQATILFFAKARELVGCKECKLSIQKKLSSADLFDKIVHAFELESIRNQIILAVNDEFVVPNSILILSENDKIAVIPPLSGGLFNNKLNYKFILLFSYLYFICNIS